MKWAKLGKLALFGSLPFLVGKNAKAEENQYLRMGFEPPNSALMEIKIIDETHFSISLEGKLNPLLGFAQAPQSEDEKLAYKRLQKQWIQQSDFIETDSYYECKVLTAQTGLQIENAEEKNAVPARIEAEARYECKNLDGDLEVTVKIMEHLPNLKELRVEVTPLDASKKYSMTLSGGRSTFNL